MKLYFYIYYFPYYYPNQRLKLVFIFFSPLRESARAITDLTLELITKAKEVLKLNTQEVEPLHQSCETI